MAKVLPRVGMRNEFDITGYSPDRKLVLVGEVKYLKETSDENATFFRRNLLSHGLLSSEPYFLLVYRTTLFLWKGHSAVEAKPDYIASMKPVLKKYLKTLSADDDAAGPETLEFATKTWLSDLASEVRSPDPKSEPDKVLIESGLYESLKGGDVRRQIVE